MFWQTCWHFIWHTFWHSIWHIFWHSTWQTFWHFIWHIFWHSFWHSIWRSIWHILAIFWHSIWQLRASGAHWARRVPGWGPAVLTELGGSQVEVQRCSLSSDGPRLRSSGTQCAQTLAVEVQQCPLRAEVSEELGEELARRKWTWKWRQRWWRRRRRRRTTLIKSNNPHLAGGELYICNYWIEHGTNYNILQPSTTNLVVRYGDIKGFLIGSIEHFRTTIYVVL